jgi:hypothetical protein
MPFIMRLLRLRNITKQGISVPILLKSLRILHFLSDHHETLRPQANERILHVPERLSLRFNTRDLYAIVFQNLLDSPQGIDLFLVSDHL